MAEQVDGLITVGDTAKLLGAPRSRSAATCGKESFLAAGWADSGSSTARRPRHSCNGGETDPTSSAV